jgi:hypothetical protein
MPPRQGLKGIPYALRSLRGWGDPGRRLRRSQTMPLPRTRLLALGVAAVGLVAAGWLYAAEPPAAAAKPDAGPVQTVDQAKPADQADSSVRVDAPGTRVAVDKDSGKVSVKAPHTDVRVDPDKGRVQVRAPYVNLDIRW